MRGLGFAVLGRVRCLLVRPATSRWALEMLVAVVSRYGGFAHAEDADLEGAEGSCEGSREG